MNIIYCNKDHNYNKKYDNQVCDRHIRLFGPRLQENLSNMTIGIVGAGGIGSILVEQLMRLYPNKIIIIDKDIVEMTNLNRLTNSTIQDAIIKKSKVDVAKRSVQSFNPKQQLDVIQGDFLSYENQRLFKECDIIFGASDSIAVRFAINQLSVPHGIIYIDCGTGVIVENEKLKHIGGQVVLINPCGDFCLYCSKVFNQQDAMSELVDNDEYQRLNSQGYIKGAKVIAPQVYALNMQIASTAVWLFMRIVSGEIIDFHGIAIDAKTYSMYVWKDSKAKRSDCMVCGKAGMRLLGDEAELLCKEDSVIESKLQHNLSKPDHKNNATQMEILIYDEHVFNPYMIIK